MARAENTHFLLFFHCFGVVVLFDCLLAWVFDYVFQTLAMHSLIT